MDAILLTRLISPLLALAGCSLLIGREYQRRWPALARRAWWIAAGLGGLTIIFGLTLLWWLDFVGLYIASAALLLLLVYEAQRLHRLAMPWPRILFSISISLAVVFAIGVGSIFILLSAIREFID